MTGTTRTNWPILTVTAPAFFYSYFAALGLDIGLEDTPNNGCIDIAVLHKGQVYLIKTNVVEFALERRALQQIKDKGYADKYRALGESNYLIGKEFSKTSLNIFGFEVATLLFK